MNATARRRLLSTRAACAFVRASALYRSNVAGATRAQLGRWEERARAIPDPRARALALGKLHAERLNAEGAAMLATRTPRAHRHDALAAIVALEVLYDYLDGLSEPSSGDALRDKRQLFTALLDAVGAARTASPDAAAPPNAATPANSAAARSYYRYHPFDDGGYMAALAALAGATIERLPAAAAVTDTLTASAARCAEAQVRVHAAESEGRAQAEEWARRAALGSPLQWREFLAGAASSVVGQHALIAAAANAATTPARAAELDELYLSICAVTTLLDSVVDHDGEGRGRDRGFLAYYDGDGAVAVALTRTAGEVLDRAAKLRDGAFHAMIFTGIVAYYASAPGAASERARPVIAPLVAMMRPSISPNLLLWRAWRARTHARSAGEREQSYVRAAA